MALQLDPPTIEPYREFYGINTAVQMSILIADGRNPLNVAQLMERRLCYRNGPAKVKAAWMDNFFNTCDAVLYHPDGRIKIVPDSQTLRKINSRSIVEALILPDGLFEQLQGTEFTRKELEGHMGVGVGTYFSVEEVKANPVWRALARDDNLLREYADYIFSEVNQRFKNNRMMGVLFAPARGWNAPTLRAWYVGSLQDGSYANGNVGLHTSGRFVGLTQNALSVSAK